MVFIGSYSINSYSQRQYFVINANSIDEANDKLEEYLFEHNITNWFESEIIQAEAVIE